MIHSLISFFRQPIPHRCRWLEAEGVGMTSACRTAILVEENISLATVVAKVSLPVVEVGEHLWLLSHAFAVPVGVGLPHLCALVAPYALVVVGE